MRPANFFPFPGFSKWRRVKSLEKEIEYYLIRSFKRLGIDLELHILVAIDYRGFVRNT